MNLDFDPVRHGFGFRNPVGIGESRLGSLVYGRGLCFGMVVGSLAGYMRGAHTAAISENPSLLTFLKRLHLSQFRPLAVVRIVSQWLRDARVSAPDISLAGDPDPHIICFGPSRSLRSLTRFGGSHAVVPYRTEKLHDGERVYVYDPNHPGSRERFVTFLPDGGFVYGGFTRTGGWSIYLLPLSAVSPGLRPVRPVAPPR